MLTFRDAVGMRSRDVFRDGVYIGYLDWLQGQSRVVLRETRCFITHLTLQELQQCTTELTKQGSSNSYIRPAGVTTP